MVEASPALTPASEAQVCAILAAALERATRWIIETQPLEEPAGALAGRTRGPLHELLGTLPGLLPVAAWDGLRAAADALVHEGVPYAAAGRVAALDRLAEALEIVCIAADVGLPVREVAEVSFRLADIVDLDWVRHALCDLPAEDRWERRAVEGLQQGLTYARRRLTRTVLSCREDGEPVEQCLAAYAATHRSQLAKFSDIVHDIKNAPRATLPALLVVMRELGRLADARG
jgi:glutamate dehydrogenase